MKKYHMYEITDSDNVNDIDKPGYFDEASMDVGDILIIFGEHGYVTHRVDRVAPTVLSSDFGRDSVSMEDILRMMFLLGKKRKYKNINITNDNNRY